MAADNIFNRNLPPNPETTKSSSESSNGADGVGSKLVAQPTVSGRLPVTPESRRVATGPRTERGKRTASRNATKHGIFSKAVLLEGESPAKFQRLRSSLMNELQPRGVVRKFLVEKLAVNMVRHERMITAETEAIQKHREPHVENVDLQPLIDKLLGDSSTQETHDSQKDVKTKHFKLAGSALLLTAELEHLIRYDAHLTREFGRILSLLELADRIVPRS